MKRKIIQLAGKTFVVSLPSKWAKLQGINKGDEVEVVEQDNSLTISIEKKKFHSKASADVTGLKPMVKRIVASLYKAGYDELEITYSNGEELRRIQEVLQETCMGFEIISKTNSLVRIKNISTIKDDQYQTLLRRSWMVILEMGSELEKAYKDQNNELYDTVILSDLNLNRFSDFCRRVLNTSRYVSERPLPEYVIVEIMEKIGDLYKDLGKLFKNRKIRYDETIAKELKTANSLLRLFYEIFYEFNYKDLTRFRVERDSFNKRCDKYYQTLKPEQVQSLMLIQQITEFLFDLNGVLIARNAGS